jgi:hypothetical protein
MARSYGVFSWARAPAPLAVAGAGHARENGLTPELPSQTIMTGIWLPPTHENHPLSPEWGGRVWVRGCIFTVKKQEHLFASLRETFWLRPSALWVVSERKPRFFGKKFEIRISKSETMTKTEMFQ